MKKLTSDEIKNMSIDDIIKNSLNTEKDEEPKKDAPKKKNKSVNIKIDKDTIQMSYMILGGLGSLVGMIIAMINLFPSNKELKKEQENMKTELTKNNEKIDKVIEYNEKHENDTKAQYVSSLEKPKSVKEVIVIQPNNYNSEKNTIETKVIASESKTEEITEDPGSSFSENSYNKKSTDVLKNIQMDLYVFGNQQIKDGGVLILRNKDSYTLNSNSLPRNTKIYADVIKLNNKYHLNVHRIMNHEVELKGYDLDYSIGIPIQNELKDNTLIKFK